MTEKKSLRYSRMTDHTAVTNVTQQGKVGLTLTESDWTGDKTHVLPDAVFNKNPAVTASGDCVIPGYVYMQILVPCMKCTLCNEDKTLYDKDADGNRLARLPRSAHFCGRCGKNFNYKCRNMR